MKLVQSLIVAALIAAPAVSFAQSNQPVTRAQVRAELIQLQQAGYNPASDNTQYPKNIEAALSQRVNRVPARVATPRKRPLRSRTCSASNRSTRTRDRRCSVTDACLRMRRNGARG